VADIDDEELARAILTSFDTIAVVGLSTNPAKAAHAIPAALQGAGYRVIPVHPWADEILGEPYRSLRDVPTPVEIVDVFRPARDHQDALAPNAAAGRAVTRPHAACETRSCS